MTYHPHTSTQHTPFIVISTIEAHYRIPLHQIIYLTSHNSSTQLHIQGNHHLVAAHPITHFETQLTPHGFLRIHQSTIINTLHLHAICKKDDTNTALLSTGQKLTIARAKKTETLKALKALSIEQNRNHPPQPYNPPKQPITGN
jgi:two-component system LytT family response regulator